MKRTRRYRQRKNRKRIINAVIVIAVIVAVVFCIFNLKSCDEFVPVVNKQKSPISNSDADAAWDDEKATHIKFNGNSVEISGGNGGAAAEGQTITLSKAGTYVLSGTLSSGKVLVNATNKDNVQIVLNGVSLTNTLGSALMVAQANETCITVPEGTDNSIIDASVYTELTDNEDAALFAKDDLLINGSGKLNVVGNYKHGIVSKNDIKICGTNIDVTAASDGIKGRDVLAASNASLKVATGGDGLQADNVEDASLGNVFIENSKLSIESKGDSVQAESALQIIKSELALTSGGGSVVNNTLSSWGTWGTAADPTTSAKGLKANRSVYIENSTIESNSSDDAIYSGGNIQIDASALSLKSGDDALAVASECAVKGGSINAEGFDGVTAAKIALYETTANITARNDGINTLGGNNVVSRNGLTVYGGNVSDNDIIVNGGTLNIAAQHDGIDSIGKVKMAKNAQVAVNVSEADSALAVNTAELEISKDTDLLALGSSENAVFCDTGKDNAVFAKLPSKIAKNDTVYILDGTTIVDSYTAQYDSDALYAYSDAYKKANEYIISSGALGDLLTLTPGISASGENNTQAPVITEAPTLEPTATAQNITPDVTVMPTVEATIEITAQITPTPTLRVTPTLKPTATVRPTATVKPTATAKPTVKPTAQPTVTVKPTVKPTVAPTPTVEPTKAPSTSYYVDYDFKMIKGVSPKTTALRFKVNASKLGLGDFTILDLSGNEVSNMNTYVGTGFKIKTASGQTYKIIVKGDGNGDGLED